MVNELQADTSNEFEARVNHSLFAKARLRPRVPLAEALVAARAVATRLREQRVRNWDPEEDFNLVASADALLLACTNLASFLLALASRVNPVSALRSE